MSDVTLECSECRRELPPLSFIPTQRRRGGRCKDCRNADARARRAAARTKRQAEREALLAAGRKLCVMCDTIRPVEDFHRDRRRQDGRFPYCKPCRIEYDGRTPRAPRMYPTKAEYDRAYRQTMPSREKTTRHRDRYLWTTYRITQAEYDAMYDRQGGVCAICQEPESDTSHLGTPKHMAVDHDHNCCPGRESCGRCVRALLCTRCNQGLGHFRDDIEVLRAAVAYLAHHERVRTDPAA